MVPKRVQDTRKRAVQTNSFLFDEKLSAAVLVLAGPDIATEADAETLFRRELNGGKPFSQLTMASPLSGQTFATHDWDDAQDWLRKWLPRILEAPRLAESGAAALARELNEALALSNVGTLRLGRRLGEFELTLDSGHESFLGAAMRGVLPFLLPYGWQRRLGRCELKGCARWFLRKYQTGPRQQYCSEEHAQNARARRYRGRRA